ncbi:hypothetical protein [Variovorax sp. Sphag1AA]|uniref:hypothetical protein n=1 Tax=Variovorax sp. Sphag1AA TaxID=2587027 RepID=UPI0017C653FA|nr:hypothetical protein [Variovorax sp. Sphag1AA]MBB3182077.1 hypothetical protein [Variovorax sp. Sphag1AA]
MELKANNKKRLALLALSALTAAAITACGGGGNGGFALPVATSSPTTTTQTDSTTVTGVAATGSPIASSAVELKCASGATGSATTDANGVWTATFKSTDYPCVARVQFVQVNNVYTSLYANALPTTTTTWIHSVVAAPGTANITPLTDLIVGILGNQDPATWFAAVTNGTLSGAITSSALADALAKLKTTLSTLPGKPSLPDGFNPLTSAFSAKKGDAGDDILESYSAALQASGLTQAQAAAHAAAGEDLTQESYVATAFTTPNLTAFRVGAAKTLAGQYAVAIPDPNRGATWATGGLDSNGNLTSVELGPYVGVVSKDQNRAVELCSWTGGAQRSQYVFVAEDLVPVTDPTELQGQYFIEYENCTATGTSMFLLDGSFVFTPTSGPSDAPDMNIAQAFTEAGLEKQETGGLAVRRAKAFKYTVDGFTKYVYVMVNTRKDSTTPELNGDTDYVLMGISQMPS